MNTRLMAKASIIALAAGIALPQTATAQTAVDVLRDEIFVTATKTTNAENVQGNASGQLLDHAGSDSATIRSHPPVQNEIRAVG